MKTWLLKKLVDNIPNKIRITQKVSYEIVFIDEFIDGRTLGECRFDTKQIVLNKNQSLSETIKSLIHECFHALAMENDFELTENQVLALEDAIYRFLRLNKVFEFFFGK